MHYVDQCQADAWWLLTWPRKDPLKVTERVFRCRSWRHVGECAEWRAESDYARIMEGMSKHTHWCHVVLTYHNWDGRNLAGLWRQSLSNWAKLRKRITRMHEKFVYVQTWEVTRKGCPHCHMAISSRKIHRLCKKIPSYLDKQAKTAIGQWNFEECFGYHPADCGFGPRGFVEAIYGQKGFVKYLEKLKRELTQAASKSQLPLDAPRHFRRLRASVGLIPPPHKDPEVTGILCNRHGLIIEKRKALS